MCSVWGIFQAWIRESQRFPIRSFCVFVLNDSLNHFEVIPSTLWFFYSKSKLEQRAVNGHTLWVSGGGVCWGADRVRLMYRCATHLPGFQTYTSLYSVCALEKVLFSTIGFFSYIWRFYAEPGTEGIVMHRRTFLER